MATINIAITAQPADFEQFANELGYQTEVQKSPAELALLTEPIAIQDRVKPNPQTRMQYVEAYLKRIVVDELYRQKARVIDNAVDASKIAEKEALKAVLTSVVAVSST